MKKVTIVFDFESQSMDEGVSKYKTPILLSRERSEA